MRARFSGSISLGPAMLASLGLHAAVAAVALLVPARSVRLPAGDAQPEGHGAGLCVTLESAVGESEEKTQTAVSCMKTQPPAQEISMAAPFVPLLPMEQFDPALPSFTEMDVAPDGTSPPAAHPTVNHSPLTDVQSEARTAGAFSPSPAANLSEAISTHAGTVDGTAGKPGAPNGRRAAVLRAAKPPYPPQAVHAGIEGVVLLSVTIESSGTASDVNIAASSGHRDLDAAAARAVKRWTFQPATHEGRNVASVETVLVRFKLEN
jgi:TonB family protein